MFHISNSGLGYDFYKLGFFWVLFKCILKCVFLINNNNLIETNKVKKEIYLKNQNNTVYKFSNKSKLQKQIRKLHILTEMAA